MGVAGGQEGRSSGRQEEREWREWRERGRAGVAGERERLEIGSSWKAEVAEMAGITEEESGSRWRGGKECREEAGSGWRRSRE